MAEGVLHIQIRQRSIGGRKKNSIYFSRPAVKQAYGVFSMAYTAFTESVVRYRVLKSALPSILVDTGDSESFSAL